MHETFNPNYSIDFIHFLEILIICFISVHTGILQEKIPALASVLLRDRRNDRLEVAFQHSNMFLMHNPGLKTP